MRPASWYCQVMVLAVLLAGLDHLLELLAGERGSLLMLLEVGLLGWLAACLAAWLPAWLPGCLAAWLPGCLAAWLPGCLAAMTSDVHLAVAASRSYKHPRPRGLLHADPAPRPELELVQELDRELHGGCLGVRHQGVALAGLRVVYSV